MGAIQSYFEEGDVFRQVGLVFGILLAVALIIVVAVLLFRRFAARMFNNNLNRLEEERQVLRDVGLPPSYLEEAKQYAKEKGMKLADVARVLKIQYHEQLDPVRIDVQTGGMELVEQRE